MKNKILQLPRADRLSFSDLVAKLTALQETDPIDLILTGDEHFGTSQHDNNSVLLGKVFKSVPHRLVGTIGDMVHNPKRLDRLTPDDCETIGHHRAKGEAGQHLPFISGNHDHDLYHRAEAMAEMNKISPNQDLLWIKQPRLLEEVVYGVVNHEVFYGPSAVRLGLVEAETIRPDDHPGFFDAMIILIGNKLFLLRHGDLWDTWYKRDDGYHSTTKEKFKRLVAGTGSGIYDLLAFLDRTGTVGMARHGNTAKIIKKCFNQYRRVCSDIAWGSTRELLNLTASWQDRLSQNGVTLGGSICGHTHLATSLEVEGLLHINLGDCRGKMVSVLAVTESGQVRGPYEVFED